MTLIRLNDIAYQYLRQSKPVLSQVSFNLQPGRTLGLLGINGAGKSTLVGLMTGQLSFQSGDLFVFGQSYAKHRMDILKKIALVPQGYAFYPSLTVLENLTFFAKLRPDLSELKQRIQDALAFCQLEDEQHKRAEALSGGLKRRLNLAIGVVNRPQLLFLDEPTVGIDPQSRDFILKAILRLKAQGVSIVYTSHQLDEIEKLCDDVVLLHQGRVQYQGSLVSLKEQKGTVFHAKNYQAWLNLAAFKVFCTRFSLTLSLDSIDGHLANDINLQMFTQDWQDLLAQEPQAKLLAFSLMPMSMESLFLEMVSPQVMAHFEEKADKPSEQFHV